MSQVLYITPIAESEPTRVYGIPQTQPYLIHPHLIEGTDPVKGRQFRASNLIPKGACLLVDHPYAIIPVVDNPGTNDNLLCSNPACNRRALRHKGRYPCPNACIPDVIWCSNTCKDTDKTRHGFECTWLKRYAGPIRAKWGEYDFGMLWIIIRLLATRYTTKAPDPSTFGSVAESSPNQLKHGWEGIDSLCGSSETWSHEQVRSWTTLVKKYLQDSPVLPHSMSADRVLHLICQEEANSFGLYPRETGTFPFQNPPVDRGEQFAAAVYPSAALANHSCIPNMIHKPDEQARMVFTASRDIPPGEECCISYFDLTQFTDLTSRREHLRKSFRFVCQCERCVSEEPEKEEATEWTAMPLMDI